MASVTFPQNLSGDGSTVSDDADPVTGLGNSGHRLRFVPALAQTVAIAGGVVTRASAAQTSATSAASSASSAASASTTAQSFASQAAATSLGAATALPSIRPSLALHFAKAKAVPPFMSFTRTTTGSFTSDVQIDGDQNLASYSEQFDNIVWTKTNTTVTADFEVAPDGTLTADRLLETTATGLHGITRSAGIRITAGLNYTESYYVKKGTGATAPDIIQLYFGTAFTAGIYVNFNIVLGTVTASLGMISTSITDAGNGWWRIQATALATVSSAATPAMALGFTNNSGVAIRAPSYAGSATADVLVWGAQLEERSFMTSYVQTVLAPVRRFQSLLKTAAINQPRIEFNGNTKACKGLLVEAVRTNLALYSQDVSNAVWTKTAVSQDAGPIRPDGTAGIKLSEGFTTSAHSVEQSVTVTAVAHTFSVWLKAQGRNYAIVELAGTFATTALVVDLVAGTISTGTGTPTNTRIENKGSGWYRVALTQTPTAGTGIIRVYISQDGDYANRSYAGIGYYGIAATMFQLEAIDRDSSYILTTASQVTRGSDSAFVTGDVFLKAYNPQAATLYIESASYRPVSGASVVAIEMGDGAAQRNRISLQQTSANNRLLVTAGAVTQSTLDRTPAPSRDVFSKHVGAFAFNDAAATANALAVLTDTSFELPGDAVSLQIGASGGAAAHIDGHVADAMLYPARLSNSELVALTQPG